MDYAIPRPQYNSTSLLKEPGKLLMHDPVFWCWICCCMTERLHDKRCLEFKAHKFFYFLRGHRPGCILRTYGCYFWKARLSWSHTRKTACLTHDFLSKSETF